MYEQVTPVEKGGADVLEFPQRTVAAADGSAVTFASLEGIGDVRGFGVSTDFIATRDVDGSWTTHGVTPPQEPADFGLLAFGNFESRYELFSDDLSHGVFLARSPLTDAPNVASAINLYARDDVLQAGAGSYELLTSASSPQKPSLKSPWVADVSADFSHITFESFRKLTPDSSALDPSQPKLYESTHSALRLVSVLPADEGGGPTVGEAGQGVLVNVRRTRGTMSRDGRRVIFTAPPFSEDSTGGALYVRDDQGTPSVADDVSTRISASERTDCNDDPSCGGDDVPDPTPDPSSPGGVVPPATFWAANADGSQIFFTTDEQLTDDDVNHSTDLYRFDLNAPVGSRLLRLSVDDEPLDNTNEDLHNGSPVTGVVGASADGSYVYFTVRQGQLVAGSPTGLTGGERIFRWHGGTLREVGAINEGVELGQVIGTGGFVSQNAGVTPDGTHLVFVTEGTDELLSLYGQQEYNHGSSCPLTAGTECLEVYVYDASANGGAGGLQCASCNPGGQPATSDAQLDSGLGVRGGARPTFRQHRVMSDDGRFVFFNTGERLSPDDENTAYDAYEFDTTTGQVHLLSSGRGSGDQLFMDVSADGRDVFFTSREQLRSTDQDQSRDLYDARIDGVPDPGLSEQLPPCAGDGCRPPATSPPGAITTPPTAWFSSLGNLKPVTSPKLSKHLTKTQKLKKALKACKAKHGKAKRKKCESSARKRLGKSGGSQ